MIFLIFSFSLAFAQPNNKRAEKVQKLKKEKLVEFMNLSESESTKFLAKYNEVEKNISNKHSALKTLNDDLEHALKENKSNKELSDLSNKLLNAHHEYQAAISNRFEEFKNILNEKQFAQYLVFEKKFLKKIRDVLKKRRVKN
ncbi:MAG TPA: hypothetical protein PLE30_03235 [Candidatus Kapabacteria bacterium]|nr:hypothetical protein [Candidatus Kapabacteria bacterium]